MDKNLETLEDYVAAYERAISSSLEVNVDHNLIAKPEVWIYFKWTDVEEIEYPGEPKYIEKLEELWKTNPKLASVVSAGANEVERMMNFFGIS